MSEKVPFTAYIVDGVRTAGGRRGGRLSKVHPVDLGAQVINELVKRTAVHPAQIDDVIFGVVSQVGAQSGNVARSIVLASNLPISVPATTVDRQCGSGQQAIHFAAQAVLSGTNDIVIAGGVENMSMVPIGASAADGFKAGHGHPHQGSNLDKKWPGVVFSQFTGAELLAEKYELTREQLDQMAVASHKRAAAATKAGAFKHEIVPIKGLDKEGKEVIHDTDEGIRPGTNIEGLRGLKPLSAKPGARITAGTASQICDGAACVMVVNERGLKKLGPGVRPRARIVSMAVVGSDPVIMLEGPIPATHKALQQAGLSIKDIDLYEVNEAFASVPAAWAKAVGADIDKLNVNGGAMALGHPLGATGAKLMTTLINNLEQRKGRYGLLAICEGGGTANATIIERIPAEEGSKLRAKL